MKVWPVLAILALSGCSRAKEELDPRYDQVSTVMLLDIQGLFGGSSVFLKRDGTTVVQIVTPPKKIYPEGGLDEHRYQMTLGKDEVEKIINLLREHAFHRIHIKDHPGAADEGRPTVVVQFSTGYSSTVGKWSSDSNADFDAIYQVLLGIANRSRLTIPVKDGRFDERWIPEGFSVPIVESDRPR